MYTELELFDEFLEHLQGEKNVSKHTIANYKSDIKLFISFLKMKNIPVDTFSITFKELKRYQIYMKTTLDYKNETIRRKTNSLRSYYNWLHEMEYIEVNPATKLHAPKKEKTEPIFLNQKELTLLLNAPLQIEPDYFAFRDHVFLYTIAYTGLRRGEAINLNWGDIKLEESYILVRGGKGNKDRIVPIPQKLIDKLNEYRNTINVVSNNAPVFLSCLGNRFSTTQAQHIFVKALKKAGLTGRGLTLHKLRHTYATNLAKVGSVVNVQQVLGHSELSTTQRYTHTNIADILDHVNKLE